MNTAVSLYTFDLDAPLADAAPGWLSASEYARAERLALPLLRRRFIAGRAGMRQLLARHCARQPAQLEIVDDSNGKPQLADRALAFNLSHSGRHALLAVGPAQLAIGVDIEELARLGDLAGLARLCLTMPEHGEFMRLPDDATRREAFLRTWVRKEACLKAIGQGLRIEPDEFAIQPGTKRTCASARIRGTQLYVVDIELGTRARAAALALIETRLSASQIRLQHLGAASFIC